MSNEHELSAEEILAQAGFNPETGADEAPLPEEAFEQQRIAKAMEMLIAENAEMKDRVLRTSADMENLRNRTARDVRDGKTYAVSNFARDMLAIADSLHTGLAHFTDEQRKTADASVLSLIEGMELTERALMNTLERHGVKKLDPMGEKFDPNFHQAMFEIPNIELPNNTIMNVVQNGYVIGERLLRPAMVGVSKGGPKIVEVKNEDE